MVELPMLVPAVEKPLPGEGRVSGVGALLGAVDPGVAALPESRVAFADGVAAQLDELESSPGWVGELQQNAFVLLEEKNKRQTNDFGKEQSRFIA